MTMFQPLASGQAVTADWLNRSIGGAVRTVTGPGVVQTDDYVAISPVEPGAGAASAWAADISGSTPLVGESARWEYFVVEVGFRLIANTFERVVIPDTVPEIAYNMVELAHVPETIPSDPWYVWGVDIHALPDTMEPRPVGGGGVDDTHKVNVPVRIYTVADYDGNEVNIFWAIGSIDGSCE